MGYPKVGSSERLIAPATLEGNCHRALWAADGVEALEIYGCHQDELKAVLPIWL